VNNGTATIDTGWQNLASAPVSGNQYRIMLTGSVVANPPNPTINLAGIGSLPITPVP